MNVDISMVVSLAVAVVVGVGVMHMTQGKDRKDKKT
jgi:hypothetical protein